MIYSGSVHFVRRILEMQKIKTNVFMLITLFISLTTIVIITGCGGGGGGSDDSTAPTVQSVTPADGSIKVLINTAVSATFSKAMDASTLTTNTFTLSPSTVGIVRYNTGTATATFTPSAGLAPGTTYTATVTTNAKDTTGNSLGTDTTWSFTTEEFIHRVSVASGGAQGDNNSYSPSISADGRYVAFQSYATNLVAGDTNGTMHIFIHDTQTGETTLVSVDSSGIEGNGISSRSSMSADGRYVAFQSDATNLVAGDTNGNTDVFIHDTQTGTTTRVSVDSYGLQSSVGNNQIPSISADGRYVAFESGATNLVSGDTNGTKDIFIHDTQTGTTTRVSVDSSGTESNGTSYSSAISADGRYVAFESLANNLVTGDTNTASDVFIHDTQTGTTTRVSVDSSGTQGDNSSSAPSISADGRYVAFDSIATNLVAGDTNAYYDVFIHDTQTGTTTRVSVDSNGTEGDSDSYYPSISADGRYVAFESDATNLVAGDTNSVPDIFIYDTQTGTTTRVSVDSSGTQGDNSSSAPSISADGRYVAFQSDATNLVADDTNAYSDVFRVLNQ
jgi:Tol biopolymer transport system component